jgi:hypothetical protein
MNKFFMFILIVFSANVSADGVVVDKVYHPYVLANEREIEWRLMSNQTDNGNDLAQRLGYGQSIAENVMIEVYVIAEEEQSKDFGIQAYEIEARWMITEQGQYWADWGMLFEFEKQRNSKDYEATVGLLVEKEFNKTSITLNFFAIREWGKNIESEWESEFRMQYRYRYLPEFQPAIELYSGEDFVGIGPAFMGIHRFNGQKQLKWEAGFITEIAHSGKNHTLRFSIEYEF